jgi:hypothetical protein
VDKDKIKDNEIVRTVTGGNTVYKSLCPGTYSHKAEYGTSGATDARHGGRLLRPAAQRQQP